MHNNLNWEKSGLTWYLCCGSSRALLNKALLHFLCLPVCFVCWLVLKVVRKEALNTIRWAQVPKWIEISWYVCSRHIPILLCIFLRLRETAQVLFDFSYIWSFSLDSYKLWDFQLTWRPHQITEVNSIFSRCNQHKS